MEFKDCLITIRRTKGLSQEALADELGVSRQAVSKWENGDAMPDLNKLLLLADVLETSIDELCGREYIKCMEESNSKEVTIKPKKSPMYRFALVGVLIVIIGLGSFLVGMQIGSGDKVVSTVKAEDISKVKSTAKPQSTVEKVKLPDTVKATLTDLKYGGKCSFVPSIINKDCHYEISVTNNATGKSYSREAECVDGVCTAYLFLEKFNANGDCNTYTIVAVISMGDDSRSVLLANDVQVDTNSISWNPVE